MFVGIWAQLQTCVRLFATLWTAARQTPLSMGFSRQEYWRMEWVAISLSRGSSWPKDWTCVFYLAGGFFTTEPPGKPLQMFNCTLKWSVIFESPKIYELDMIDDKLLLFDRLENWVIRENLSESVSNYFSYHLFLYISIEELSLLT